MAEKSLIQYAFDVLKEAQQKMSFLDLFNAVSAKANLGELSADDKKLIMARFYTALTIDGNFICLQNNEWDLGYRYTEEVRHPSSLEESYTDLDDDASEGVEDVEEIDGEREPNYDEDSEEEEPEYDFDRSKRSDDEQLL